MNFKINIISVFFVILLGCNNKEIDNKIITATGKDVAGQNNDTINYSIILYDTLSNDKNEHYYPVILTKTDIINIEKELRESVKDYNFNKSDTINISKYKRLYTPVINNKGEKEVWLYCSCNGNFEIVVDGGKCYFRLKINLSKKTYTQIEINSEG